MRITERIVFGFAGVCLIAATAFALLARGRAAPAQRTAATAPEAKGTVTQEILAVESGAFNDARWYIADGRSHSVHVLDSAGQHVTSMGRRGRGPGEFVAPTLVAASGTRVYVAEIGRTEISVFDTSGAFVRFLRVAGTCARGRVVAMAATGNDLYAVRRCLELPRSVRYQLERSVGGAMLEAWLMADTVRVPSGGGVPINFRLLAASADRLVLGDGDTGCLRAIQLPAGRPLGRRCLYGIIRKPVPDSARQQHERRWRGRVALPDSLPRFIGLVLFDSSFAAQSVQGLDATTWLEFSWTADRQARGRPLGRAGVESSFLGRNTQLIAWAETEGVRIEVVRVQH